MLTMYCQSLQLLTVKVGCEILKIEVCRFGWLVLSFAALNQWLFISWTIENWSRAPTHWKSKSSLESVTGNSYRLPWPFWIQIPLRLCNMLDEEQDIQSVPDQADSPKEWRMQQIPGTELLKGWFQNSLSRMLLRSQDSLRKLQELGTVWCIQSLSWKCNFGNLRKKTKKTPLHQ